MGQPRDNGAADGDRNVEHAEAGHVEDAGDEEDTEGVEDGGDVEDFVNVAGDTDTEEAEHIEDPGDNHLRSQHRLKEKK